MAGDNIILFHRHTQRSIFSTSDSLVNDIFAFSLCSCISFPLESTVLSLSYVTEEPCFCDLSH